MDAPPGSEPGDDAPSRHEYLVWLDRKARLIATEFWLNQELYEQAPQMYREHAVQVHAVQALFHQFHDAWRPWLARVPALSSRTELDRTPAPADEWATQFLAELRRLLEHQNARVADLKRLAGAESMRREECLAWLERLQVTLADFQQVLDATTAVRIPPAVRAVPTTVVTVPAVAVRNEQRDEISGLAPAALLTEELAAEVQTAAAGRAADVQGRMLALSTSLRRAAVLMTQAVTNNDVASAFTGADMTRTGAHAVWGFVAAEHDDLATMLARYKAERERLAPVRERPDPTENLAAVLSYLAEAAALGRLRADAASTLASKTTAVLDLVGWPQHESAAHTVADDCRRIRDEFLTLIRANAAALPRKRAREDFDTGDSSSDGDPETQHAERPAKWARTDQPGERWREDPDMARAKSVADEAATDPAAEPPTKRRRT